MNSLEQKCCFFFFQKCISEFSLSKCTNICSSNIGVCVFVCVLKANDTAPDKIQSKGNHMPVERSLSEEQCKF